LPKGYQISQYQQPFTVKGFIDISDHRVRINRAHMEEDTAKSIHSHKDGQEISLIDFNRSGVPLVEIVSEPDIFSPEMAKDYLLKIQQLMRYLNVSYADIEKGSMRCEPTVNVKIESDSGIAYTPLVEIKNVASLTGVQYAIQYEIDRQITDWQENGTIKTADNKTTRGWDAVKGVTFLQREKEGSSDYRYFPEPDIPPVEYSGHSIDHIKSTIPELPQEKIKRYMSDYDLTEYDASLLASDINFAKSYEKALSDSKDPDYAKFTANIFNGPIRNYLNQQLLVIDPEKINPLNFQSLYQSVKTNRISTTVARQIIVDSYLTGKDPRTIAKDENLIQVSD
jgi:aspartyl-tRNA(Asn)/glutamyl-tRNA(Gln) amidotransferase subunit B